jgi:penicillin-binding protein 1B
MATRIRSRSRRRTPSFWRRFRAVLLQLVLLATLVIASYVLWIDHQIGERFARHRWELPARVYARPVELYAGSVLPPESIERELQRLSYRRVTAITGPGQYAMTGGRMSLRTRGFRFPDGSEPGRQMHIDFAADTMRALTDGVTGAVVPLARLEPVEIAKIYPRHAEDRILVRIDEVPDRFVDALLAVEDRHFRQHHGVDVIGILRALVVNIMSGEIRQGGSTLTQQLVKNFYLGRERTLGRKLNEAVMAVALERRFSKNEILEAYLNEVYLGQDGARAIHGFGTAAQFYFGRPLNELSLGQMALLAGLPRGASIYDPRRFPDRCRQRRDLVIDAMVTTDTIAEHEAAMARREPLGVLPRPPSHGVRYPAFVELVRRQLSADYQEADLQSAGLQVFTTLNTLAQEAAEQAVVRQLGDLERGRPSRPGGLEAAVVVTDVGTGEIAAMVGGRDPAYAGFNRVLDAHRQIGSMVKPAVYLSALMQPRRYSIVTTIDDASVALRSGGKTWTPVNYDGKLHGPVRLHEALANSYNLATVRLGLDVGLGSVRARLRELGIDKPIPEVPALLLGAVELTPLDVARMYQTIAAKGFQVPLRAIREVLTHRHEVLRRYELQIHQTVRPEHAFLLTRMLREVVRDGTARALQHTFGADYALAGKTGTTNDLRDSWFAGFGEDTLAVVWLGHDNGGRTGLTGATGAMRVWADIMRQLLPEPLAMQAPRNIEWRWIAPRAEAVTDEGCPGTTIWPFITGSAPTAYEPCAWSP